MELVLELFGRGPRLLCAFSRQASLVAVAVTALGSHVLRASQSTCAMPVVPIARATVGRSAVGGMASMAIVAAKCTHMAGTGPGFLGRSSAVESESVGHGSHGQGHLARNNWLKVRR